MADPLLIIVLVAILVIIVVSILAASPPSDRVIERTVGRAQERRARGEQETPAAESTAPQTDGLPIVSVLGLILALVVVFLHVPLFVVRNWDWYDLVRYAMPVFYFSVPAVCLAVLLSVWGMVVRRNPFTLLVLSLTVLLALGYGVWAF